MGFFKKALREIGDIHQKAGNVLSGGLIKDPYRKSGSSLVGYNPYGNAPSYGRPQFDISKQDAMNSFNGMLSPTSAPTQGDLYKDAGYVPRNNFPNRNAFNLGQENLSKMFPRVRSNASFQETPYFENSPGLNWTDNNAQELGGKEAYRYNWQQPGYSAPSSPLRPLSTIDQGVINQSVPDMSRNAWTPAVNSIPTMNASSTNGMGFGSNTNTTGAFGGTPIKSSLPLSAFYQY
jgi:hypothetical protein